jgi:transposase-like protein
VVVGRIEVDETYVGGEEPEAHARQLLGKSLVTIAAQEDGRGIGRIRMARIADASAASLQQFIRRAIEPGSVVHTDGWEGYRGLEKNGYHHQVTILRGKGKDAAIELLPRVHLIAGLLKRWLLGTHQGSVSANHLHYYLDEFTFRFNRRKSRSRGKLFYRLVEQALNVEPSPYHSSVLKNRPRSDRGLVPAAPTDQPPTSGRPGRASLAARANKTVRPTKPDEVITTSLVRGKSILKFQQGPRIVFAHTGRKLPVVVGGVN